MLRQWDAGVLKALEHGLTASIGAFLDAVGAGDPELDAVLRAVVRAGVSATADSWGPPHTFVHGDLRADKLVYDGDGAPTIIDWQMCSHQGPARDVRRCFSAA